MEDGVVSPYDREFYKSVGKVSSLDVIVSLIIDIVKPESVVDFGCAKGVALSCFKARGVKDILGVDGKWVEKDLLLIEETEFMEHDFSKNSLSLEKRYDLAISTEVAEHLNETRAIDFIDSLVRASDVIVFSAAIPGQGGESHVNEQWPGYWVSMFNSHGYQVLDCLRKNIWYNNTIDFWYKQNLFLFCKKEKISTLNIPDKDIPIIDFVHPQQYEQTFYRLFNLFNQFFLKKDYETILQLAFLKDYDYSAKFFLGLVYFEKQDYINCVNCLEGFLEVSGLSKNNFFATAYYIIAVAYINLLNIQRAKECLEKCSHIEGEYKNAALDLLSKI